MIFVFFFLNDPATPEFYPLPLHDALPIWVAHVTTLASAEAQTVPLPDDLEPRLHEALPLSELYLHQRAAWDAADRKSTRLNSSHSQISYAVFCLTKKNKLCNRDQSAQSCS